MYKDETGEVVPALVDEGLWEKANEVFRRRSIDVKGRRNCSTHKNTYTGKLFCTVDHAPYYCKDVRYQGTEVSKWVCSHKIKHGADACPSVAIYENELNPIVIDAFHEFSQSADQLLEEYMELYRTSVGDPDHYIEERSRITAELSAIDKKQDQLLDMKVAGDITMDEFKRMMDKTRVQKVQLDSQLNDLSNWEDIAAQMEEQIARLKRALSFRLEDLEDNMVTRDFVDCFIKRIDVTPMISGQIGLKIHLLTDKIVDLEFEKIRGRTGQVCKKMIEAYENGLK